MKAGSLPRALRVLFALLLWVGVSMSAVWSPPADARPASAIGAAAGDPWLMLLDHLGGSRVCGDDEGEEADVFCGGDFLLDHFIDPSLLVMSRGTCSRLLERLFGDQTCDPMREVCDGVYHSGVPPPSDGQGNSSSPSALLASARPAASPRGVDRPVRVRAGDRVPTSRASAPIPPPPRHAAPAL